MDVDEDDDFDLDFGDSDPPTRRTFEPLSAGVKLGTPVLENSKLVDDQKKGIMCVCPLKRMNRLFDRGCDRTDAHLGGGLNETGPIEAVNSDRQATVRTQRSWPYGDIEN
eukprot:1343184-Amorphochlora_amoeboformis.AAC.1